MCKNGNGRYTFVITTIKNLYNKHYLSTKGYVVPCAPFLIVEKLTDEVINELIKEVITDKTLANIYGKDCF